jgi:hypothetical protein
VAREGAAIGAAGVTLADDGDAERLVQGMVGDRLSSLQRRHMHLAVPGVAGAAVVAVNLVHHDEVAAPIVPLDVGDDGLALGDGRAQLLRLLVQRRR